MMQDINITVVSELYTLFSLILTSKPHSEIVLFGQTNYSTGENLNSILISGFTNSHQISYVKMDEMLEKNIEFEKEEVELNSHFDSLTILVTNQIQRFTFLTIFNTSHPCRTCTWLFLNKDLLHPNEYNLDLLDKVLFHDSEQNLNQMYGIKGQVRIQNRIEQTKSELLLSIGSRLNFQGVQVDVAHVNKPDARTDSGNLTLEYFKNDLSYEILAYAQDMFQFIAVFHSVSTWVSFPSDNLTSMSLAITTKEVDLALTSTAMAIFQSDSRFLLPSSAVTGIRVFYQSKHLPLRGGIYEGIIGTEVLVSLLGTFGLIILASSVFYRNTEESAIIWAIGVLTGQVVADQATRYQSSARILTFIVTMFKFMSLTLVSSHLLYSLSFTKEINCLRDLTDRGVTQFGFEKKSIVENAIREGCPGSVLWEIRGMIKAYERGEDALNDVLINQKCAYIAGIEYPNEFCGELNQLIIHGQKRYGSAFVHRMSEFAEPFNYAAIKMVETGVFFGRRQDISRRKEEDEADCLLSQQYEPEIHLVDIKLTFYILMIGIAFAIFGFMVEVLKNVIRKRRRCEQLKLASESVKFDTLEKGRSVGRSSKAIFSRSTISKNVNQPVPELLDKI